MWSNDESRIQQRRHQTEEREEEEDIPRPTIPPYTFCHYPNTTSEFSDVYPHDIFRPILLSIYPRQHMK